jgi:putative transposase
MKNPFRYFDSSPEVIRLVVQMYVRYPLSLRNVEDLLAERGIDICHDTVRLWWNRFGPMFAAEIRRKRVDSMRGCTHWRWRLDEVYVKINGEMHYLWRAVDHDGEVLESFTSKQRDKATALKFIKRAMKRHGRPRVIVTDGLRSYRAAMDEIGNADRQEIGRWANNRAENSHQPFRRRERAMLRFRSVKTLQNSALSTPRSTTTSIRTATLSAGTTTRFDARPHRPSGGLSSPEASCAWPSYARAETGSRWTDSTPRSAIKGLGPSCEARYRVTAPACPGRSPGLPGRINCCAGWYQLLLSRPATLWIAWPRPSSAAS